MKIYTYVNGTSQRDVIEETGSAAGKRDSNLVIETLDEFTSGSHACFCGATNAEYIFSAAAGTARP